MPAGWLAQFDRAQKRYFFVNTNVNPPETTWTDPRGVEMYAPETATESVEDLLAQVKATKAQADALNEARAPKQFVPVEPTQTPAWAAEPKQFVPVEQPKAPGAAAAAAAPKPVQVPLTPGATGVPAGEVPLPAGWIKVLDPGSGHFYFVNQNAKPPVTTWDDPRTAEVEKAPVRPKQQAAAAAPAQATYATVPYSPPGPKPGDQYAAPASAPPAAAPAAAPVAQAPVAAAGEPTYLVGTGGQ
ncbi:hypothetical protein DFJ74DRAFT_121420 [Hyaloraphidium curvatum]|nr:hypothetical protein DFJ74DRAFT_121420 [Hyaloraphidium curvatum]